MSDKPISVGDLVMVVRSHCDNPKYLGYVATVLEFEIDLWHPCLSCGVRSFFHKCAVIQLNGGQFLSPPVAWLKRIDPLGESETERREDEVTV